MRRTSPPSVSTSSNSRPSTRNSPNRSAPAGGSFISADRQVLIDEISRLTNVLVSIEARLGRFLDDELPELGRTDVAASYVAQLIDKMTLHVAGIRERVIEDATRRDLHELLRFRHFKRYYFELEFDWKKLDYLLEVHRRMMPLLKADIDRFTLFLHRLG